LQAMFYIHRGNCLVKRQLVRCRCVAVDRPRLCVQLWPGRVVWARSLSCRRLCWCYTAATAWQPGHTHTDTHTEIHRQTDRLRHSETDRQRHTQTDRQTDRLRHRHTETQTD